MKLYAYSLFDSAAHAFTTPFFVHSDGLAVRVFQDNVNSKNESNISMHPDQFTLFKIGTFDDGTGHFQPLAAPESMQNGLTLIEARVPENQDLGSLIKAVSALDSKFTSFMDDLS